MTKIAGTIRHKLLLEIDLLKAPSRIQINDALALAEKIHEGTFRRPSKTDAATPYIVHPMRVALILLQELQMKDPEAIMGALLHDVVEESDRSVSISELEKRFGRAVALMVSILTKPVSNENMPPDQLLYFYHARIKGANLQTRLVKLADRLDNVREAADSVDTQFQERYLKETKEFFLPFAEDTDRYLYKELLAACSKLESALGLEAAHKSKE
jgi:(p)ppGpp synthase/HD superfamily hydrolase